MSISQSVSPEYGTLKLSVMLLISPFSVTAKRLEVAVVLVVGKVVVGKETKALQSSQLSGLTIHSYGARNPVGGCQSAASMFLEIDNLRETERCRQVLTLRLPSSSSRVGVRTPFRAFSA